MESVLEILNFILIGIAYVLAWYILYSISHVILESIFHWEQKAIDEAVKTALERHDACYECKPREKIDHDKLSKTFKGSLFFDR